MSMSKKSRWTAAIAVIATTVVSGIILEGTKPFIGQIAGGGTSDRSAQGAPTTSPGSLPYSPPPPAHPLKPQRVVMGPLEDNVNLQGADFSAAETFAANAPLCAEMCRVDEDCKAMTYVKSMQTCWLKSAVPPATVHPDMISARKLGETG